LIGVFMHRLYRWGFPVFISLLTLPACASQARGAAASSRNRDGNRLFEQGKYREAEEAYLSAQAESPDSPELFYNLGNALIKQRKRDQALQALRQAISKGHADLQASAWYNLGNSLFEMGDFENSAQAFIRALRLRPADHDAKHNLELAQRRMNEKKQIDSGEGEKRSPGQSSIGEQGRKPRNNAEQKRPDRGPGPGEGEIRMRNASPDSAYADRLGGPISKERALQILDALRDQELAEQLKLLEGRAGRQGADRYW
jgi:Ca-activated chloride channel homolog